MVSYTWAITPEKHWRNRNGCCWRANLKCLRTKNQQQPVARVSGLCGFVHTRYHPTNAREKPYWLRLACHLGVSTEKTIAAARGASHVPLWLRTHEILPHKCTRGAVLAAAGVPPWRAHEQNIQSCARLFYRIQLDLQFFAVEIYIFFQHRNFTKKPGFSAVIDRWMKPVAWESTYPTIPSYASTNLAWPFKIEKNHDVDQNWNFHAKKFYVIFELNGGWYV